MCWILTYGGSECKLVGKYPYWRYIQIFAFWIGNPRFSKVQLHLWAFITSTNIGARKEILDTKCAKCYYYSNDIRFVELWSILRELHTFLYKSVTCSSTPVCCKGLNLWIIDKSNWFSETWKEKDVESNDDFTFSSILLDITLIPSFNTLISVTWQTMSIWELNWNHDDSVPLLYFHQIYQNKLHFAIIQRQCAIWIFI